MAKEHLGVYWGDENLGVEPDEYPLHYHFFEPENYKPATHNEEHGLVVGYADKVTENDPGGVLLFAHQGGVSGIHKTRIVYEK